MEVLKIPVIALPEHFVVGVLGDPGELVFGFRDVEIHRASIHKGVVGSQWR